MAKFVMEIAGMVIGAEGSFESTPVYFSRYLSSQPPEYSILVTQTHLRQEQELLDREADQEGLKRRTFTQPFLERAAIARMTAGLALNHGTILLHGSTIAVDGNAYLFTAPCGVGKSTHVRFWRELMGSRGVMVNDDRAFLQISSDGVLAFGSPWSGKHGLDTNICAPLKGICILERGSENRIEPLRADDALPFLREQVFVPADPQRAELDALTAALAQTVPLWKLACTKHISAARMAWEAMRPTDEEKII